MPSYFFRYITFTKACAASVTLSAVGIFLRERYLLPRWGYDFSGGDTLIQVAPIIFLILLFFFRRPLYAKKMIIRNRLPERVAWWCLAAVFLFTPTLRAGVPYEVSFFVEQGMRHGMYAALALAIFGRSFLSERLRDVLLLALVSLIIMLMPLVIDAYWYVFSSGIIVSLDIGLTLLRIDHHIEPATFMVRAQDFLVHIGPACAGIMMLMLFGLLYLLTIFLLSERQILSWRRVVVFGLIGIVGAVVANVIRILCILLVGIYLSEDIAITIFHDNIGALLFLAIFGWYLSMLIKKNYLIKQQSAT